MIKSKMIVRKGQLAILEAAKNWNNYQKGKQKNVNNNLIIVNTIFNTITLFCKLSL